MTNEHIENPPTPDTVEKWEEELVEYQVAESVVSTEIAKRILRFALHSQAEEIVKWAQKYDDDELDLGAEAIANHAYKDKFEAFRYGYNQALSDLINHLKETYIK